MPGPRWGHLDEVFGELRAALWKPAGQPGLPSWATSYAFLILEPGGLESLM